MKRKLLGTMSLLVALPVWVGATGLTSVTEVAPPEAVLQQTKTITVRGRVLDKAGEAIIGANIRVEGTNSGTITDINGDFTLNVSPTAHLVISFVGMKTQKIAVAGKTKLNITLEDEATGLEAVVVTALGIKRQTKALAYNAQELKAEQLLQGKDANFLTSLNGKVAGVTINQSSAGAGSAARVVMRGAKSIDGNNNALYVIDGVPLLNVQGRQGSGPFHSHGTTDAASDINPDDIASVTVLSGASAAALYGSAAANGAILITTKKGAEGAVKLSYTFSDEWGKPLKLPRFQNRYGTGVGADSWGALLPQGHTPYRVADFFDTANTQTHNLSLSGGTDKNQTYLSGAITSNKGIVPNNRYKRYNISVRNTSSLLGDRLKIDAGLNYVREYHRNMINQGEYGNPIVAAYLMPRSETMANVRLYELFNQDVNLYEQNWVYGKADYHLQNPYWQAYRNLRETNRERYVLSLAKSYQIMKWSEGEQWTIGARANYDKTNILDEEKYYASTDLTITHTPYGFYVHEQGKTSQIYLDLISTINKTIALGSNNSLSINASLGASAQDNRFDAQRVEGPLSEAGYPSLFTIYNIDKKHEKTNLAPRGWAEQTQSLFASAELGFNSYLFLTLTGRNDWASQLAKSPQQSFFYPSVGLSAVPTDMLPERIKKSIRPYLSYLKLRAAYASVASPFPRGLTTPTNSIGEAGSYKSVSHYPIGQLLPERTDSYELGLSSRWFSGLLTLDATIYRTITKNQTLKVEISSSSGYDGAYIQTGAVRNQGLELSAGLNLGKREGLHYSSNFTFSINENKILRLSEDYVNPITGKPEHRSEESKGGFGEYFSYILKTGGTLGDIYSKVDFERDVEGRVYVSEKGNLSIKQLIGSDRIYLGSVLPKANFGWSHELGYKGLSLGLQLSARTGGVVVSMTQAALDNYGVSERSALARERGGVRVGSVLVSAQEFYTTIGKNRMPQYYTYDATNVRIAQVHLSYKLDRKYLRNIADVTLSLVGRNLGFLYNKAPFDPESISSTGNYAQGLDYFMMPTQRVLGFSCKLNF